MRKNSPEIFNRILKDIGHNVPQEAPEAFARAIIVPMVFYETIAMKCRFY